jgi:MFS transporter, FHS family, L-fucose permease
MEGSINTTSPIKRKNYLFSLAVLGAFYFIFGFFHWLNGILIPFLKTACELNDFQAYFVTFAFFISYLIMAIPSSELLKKTGFKNGMTLGLWVMSVGCLIFIPAAISRTFGLFLAGLFVTGTGLALLQTAVNPYVTIIGPIKSAARRISVMGVLNKFAGALAPIILASIILKDAGLLETQLNTAAGESRITILDEMARRVITPYVAMAAFLFVFGLIVRLARLPELDTETVNDASGKINSGKKSIWQFPWLLFGVVALFFAIGVEVVAGDSIIRYGQSLGVSMESAKYYTSLTLIGMILGYLMGIIFIPKYITQVNALRVCTMLGIIFSAAAVIIPSHLAFTIPFVDPVTFENVRIVLPLTVLFVALLGFANGLLFPAIWPLAIEGLGKFTKTGSAFLVMANAGGAVLPLIYGKIANDFSTQNAYLICIPSYMIIMYYAFIGYKAGK